MVSVRWVACYDQHEWHQAQKTVGGIPAIFLEKKKELMARQAAEKEKIAVAIRERYGMRAPSHPPSSQAVAEQMTDSNAGTLQQWEGKPVPNL